MGPPGSEEPQTAGGPDLSFRGAVGPKGLPVGLGWGSPPCNLRGPVLQTGNCR